MRGPGFLYQGDDRPVRIVRRGREGPHLVAFCIRLAVGLLHPMPESSISGKTLLGTALMAEIGAGIGVGIDAIKETEVVLYQAP